MKLFGLGKEKEVSQKGCACGGACEAMSPAGEDVITGNNANAGKEATTENKNTAGSEAASGNKAFNTVKVLGSGCKKCNELEAATIEALEKLGMDTKIEHVTDFTQIAAYGVMTTPALVIDEKVVSYGKVLKTEEVVKILEKERG
jgi:hypothetical protein